MKITHYQSKLVTLLKERNALLTLALALIMLSLSLVGLCFYAFNHARTLLIPPSISRPMWLSGSQVSQEYLLEMTQFLLSLKLNVTPNNVDYQDHTLLRYIAPTYYDAFKSGLAAEREQIKNEDLASVFYPASVSINGLQVTATGDLLVTIGNTHLAPQHLSYQVQYQYSDGRLLIVELKELKNV